MRVDYEDYLTALDYVVTHPVVLDDTCNRYKGLRASMHVCHLMRGKPVFFVEDSLAVMLGLTNLDKPKVAEKVQKLETREPDSHKRDVIRRWEQKVKQERDKITKFAELFDEEL